MTFIPFLRPLTTSFHPFLTKEAERNSKEMKNTVSKNRDPELLRDDKAPRPKTYVMNLIPPLVLIDGS